MGDRTFWLWEADARSASGWRGISADSPALGAYRAHFYSNERNEPAHVHVRAGDREVKIWLHDLAVAINAGFPAHEITGIVRHLRLHRDQLLSAWHEHIGD